MIKQITNQADFIVLAKLLNEAFGTVAHEFGLTKEKAPTNSAFITSDELMAQLTENREFYAYWLSTCRGFRKRRTERQIERNCCEIGR